MLTGREDHIGRRDSVSGGRPPARSKNPCTSGNSLRENRETSFGVCRETGRPVGEGICRTSHAHVGEESEWAIVPTKGSNKGGRPLAEDQEGRACTKENVRWPRTVRTPRRAAVTPRRTSARREAALQSLGRHHPS